MGNKRRPQIAASPAAAPRFSAERWAKMTREEQMLAAAEASIRLYGTPTPPNEVILAAKVVRCSKCKHEGPVFRDFGVRHLNGLVHAQSVCYRCRSTLSAEYKRRARAGGERVRLVK